MQTFIRLSIAAIPLVSGLAAAQQRVPVLTLPAASARASEAFGPILGVRALPDGRLLVNDGGRRQVRLFDANLTSSTIVLDSMLSGAGSYGPRRTPLIAYIGDSSLFADITSQTILVLDAQGHVARAMSLPTTTDLLAFSGAATSAVDASGRLIYRGTFASKPAPGAPPAPPSDSLPLLRADLDSRRVDTLGRVSQPSATKMNVTKDADGKMGMTVVINPLQTVDDWAMLSDGTVAIVRGHDYHVDFVSPDGTKRSAPKLPFDWKKLTDEDKQRIIDSTRAATDAAEAKSAADAKNAQANPQNNQAHSAAASSEVAMMMLMKSSAGGGTAPMPISTNTKPVVQYATLKDIADYYPPIRIGATKADLDGNLWILPTTSAQSTNGELVYDVVNTKGELYQRVRLPVGRAIVGFAKGGVIYLSSYDRASAYYLERTTIVGAVKSAQ